MRARKPAWFVRSLVGLDRGAAQAAFADCLGDRSFSASQIRFVERSTAQGVMTADALHEAPFTNLHAGGPDGMFADRGGVADGLFGALNGLHEHLAARQESAG